MECHFALVAEREDVPHALAADLRRCRHTGEQRPQDTVSSRRLSAVLQAGNLGFEWQRPESDLLLRLGSGVEIAAV